jgi:hypothetical protein
MQAQAQETIADSVVSYTQMLIEALKHNYIQYAIRAHQRFVDKGESVDYHLSKIEWLKNGNCEIDYVIETGRKYHKVIMISSANSRSVHCFIDKQTGSMYKAATWKSPAKGVRFDLRHIPSREYVLENCDWSGGYLYAR